MLDKIKKRILTPGQIKKLFSKLSDDEKQRFPYEYFILLRKK